MNASKPDPKPDTRTDLQADLRADLLADLAPVQEPPTPVAEAADPGPLPQELAEVTPAVSMQWTPLRWSRPRVVRAASGPGKALRLGPLTVEVSVKH